MPIYEYRCEQCQALTTLLARINDAPQTAVCESCGSSSTHRIVSRPSVHLSRLSKVERLDPKYEKMVDRAMASNPAADPDRLINRRGDISKGQPDD